MAPKCFCGVFVVGLERVGSDLAGRDSEFKIPSNLNLSLML